jgi:hypothetical protein
VNKIVGSIGTWNAGVGRRSGDRYSDCIAVSTSDARRRAAARVRASSLVGRERERERDCGGSMQLYPRTR